MKGVATLADTLLGVKCTCETPVMFNLISPNSSKLGSFVSKNEDRKRGATAASTDQLSHYTRDVERKHSARLEHRPSGLFDKVLGGQTDASMPTENSILHLLGPWLFETALVHVDMESTKNKLSKIWQNSSANNDKRLDN